MKHPVLAAIALVFFVSLGLLLAFNTSTIQHSIAVHSGASYLMCGSGKTETTCSNQVYYNWWSGPGSDLGEATLITAVVGTAYGAYRKANCHSAGCWRLGHFPLEVKHADGADGSSTTYKVCHHCHPHINGAKLTRAELHEGHHRHREENLGLAPVEEQQ